MTFTVESEIGQLRQAIVHRPGLELSRLTPDNIGALLFDDVMWAKKAKEEHDAFAEALRDKGVRVHYYGQLLAETLETPEGRGVRPRPGLHPRDPRPVAGRIRSAACSTTWTGQSWPSTWSAGCSRPTCTRCGPTACKWDMLRADDFVLAAAAQPPLPAGQLVLDLRRRDDQPDGQAGPPARDRCTPGPSTGSTRCSPTPTSSPTTATRTTATSRPPSRAATSTSSATARC